MSRQRPTEGEGGRYSYDNSEYGDEERQNFSQSYSQQGYPQQPYSQYQQYPQQPPRQPSPRQYPHQTPSISPFQQSIPPRKPTPPQQFSKNNSFLDDNRSNDSYSDEEGTGKSHVHKDGWLFRPPENGHVITKGEIISRIVQYYEVCTILF
jgi:hypothetical protein